MKTPLNPMNNPLNSIKIPLNPMKIPLNPLKSYENLIKIPKSHLNPINSYENLMKTPTVNQALRFIQDARPLEAFSLRSVWRPWPPLRKTGGSSHG